MFGFAAGECLGMGIVFVSCCMKLTQFDQNVIDQNVSSFKVSNSQRGVGCRQRGGKEGGRVGERGRENLISSQPFRIY